MKRIGFSGWRYPALALLSLLCMGAAPEKPGGHLEPESRVWNVDRYWDYTSVVRWVFREVFGDDVVLWMHFSPSMGSHEEGFVALKSNPAQILVVHTDVPLFLYSERGRQGGTGFGKMSPADYHNVLPVRCEAAIPPNLGGRIAGAWRRVLLQTRYDETPRRGMDGEYFSFWQRVNDLRVLSGWVWSPEDDSNPGILIRVAFGMQDYCAAQDAAHLKALSSMVGLLEYHLKADEAP
ncbi:MAG TPA: hypothetical protein VHZ78_02005 [Rhizomicrobium sp.]|jgi:hypothetical protein|nr:hypothetical protein [Rhizomicrobium sp.]